MKTAENRSIPLQNKLSWTAVMSLIKTCHITMDISVIICSFNGEQRLPRTLASFQAIQLLPSLQWELILVDNNSTDGTREIGARFAQRLPIRCVTERRQGLSAARNRGIAVARGELIVFTDDDVEVDPHWLQQLATTAARHPSASFFGGKILPRWEVPPPPWLAKYSQTLLSGVVVHYDRGNKPQFLEANDRWMFYGANMAFRAAVFRAGHRFDETLGRQEHALISGEETALMIQLTRQGGRGFYVPEAVVYHHVPAGRMTEAYMRRWFAGMGTTRVRSGEIMLNNLWFGAPRRVWCDMIRCALKFALSRWWLPARIWVRAEIKMATCYGIIRESYHLHSVSHS